MILSNGDEQSLGKLSKMNKCLQWEGEVDAAENEVVAVEADWREYRMQVSPPSPLEEFFNPSWISF